MEIIDIVDENDVVLKQMIRDEAQLQKLKCRAVHVFVFNKIGELCSAATQQT